MLEQGSHKKFPVMAHRLGSLCGKIPDFVTAYYVCSAEKHSDGVVCLSLSLHCRGSK